LRNRILNPARLPVPPHPHTITYTGVEGFRQLDIAIVLATSFLIFRGALVLVLP
jgi:hypothetical protein